MENRRKIREIVIEISHRRNDFKDTRNRAWCFKCESVTELLTFSQAADLCRTTFYDFYRRAEKDEFHLIRNSKSEVLICQVSLQKICIHSAEVIKTGEFVQQIIQ